MKIKRFYICLCILFYFCSNVYSIIFNDGNIHNINYSFQEHVSVDFKTPGMHTTVNWFPGASTGNYNHLLGYQDSHINVYGGKIDYILYAFNRSQVNIYGGWIGRFLDACDGSKVSVYGGYINGDLYAVNGSRVMISGGTVKEDLEAWHNSRVTINGGRIKGIIYAGKLNKNYSSTITIEGFDFAINGVNVNYGQYFATDFISGRLTGTLAKGNLLNNRFYIYGNSKIVLARGNNKPYANAGQDQTVYVCIDEIAEVTLDGSDSNDIDGDQLSYYWSWMIDDQIYDANGVGPTIELPVGEHVIELIVNDGIEDSEPNEVVITVIEPIEADLYIAPRVINRDSRGRSVMAIMTLPKGIGKDDIDVDVVFTLLPGEIAAERQFVREDEEVVKVFALFSRSDLMDAVADNGRVELTVASRLKSGQCVYGADSVRIIKPRRSLRPRWRLVNSKLKIKN